MVSYTWRRLLPRVNEECKISGSSIKPVSYHTYNRHYTGTIAGTGIIPHIVALLNPKRVPIDVTSIILGPGTFKPAHVQALLVWSPFIFFSALPAVGHAGAPPVHYGARMGPGQAPLSEEALFQGIASRPVGLRRVTETRYSAFRYFALLHHTRVTGTKTCSLLCIIHYTGVRGLTFVAGAEPPSNSIRLSFDFLCSSYGQ